MAEKGQPTGSVGPLMMGSDLSGNAAPLPAFPGQVPVGATAVNNSSGNIANNTAAATLPAVAGKTNYVTGIEVTGAGATAAAVVVATLAGLLGGTASYIITAPAGATVAILPLVVIFDPPMPASAVNTAITLSVPALGAGNTNVAANIHGFVI